MKVISGAQTGADIGGLMAAEGLGIATGGWMPKGCRTDEGAKPELLERFGLKETVSAGYLQRTLLNVKECDVTILFGDVNSRGCTLTQRYCGNHSKPMYYGLKVSFIDHYTDQDVDHAAIALLGFLLRWRPKTINVAGNRERSNLGIEQWTTRVLTIALREYQEDE